MYNSRLVLGEDSSAVESSGRLGERNEGREEEREEDAAAAGEKTAGREWNSVEEGSNDPRLDERCTLTSPESPFVAQSLLVIADDGRLDLQEERGRMRLVLDGVLVLLALNDSLEGVGLRGELTLVGEVFLELLSHALGDVRLAVSASKLRDGTGYLALVTFADLALLGNGDSSQEIGDVGSVYGREGSASRRDE